jgi:uncharacterized protein YrzB (UPF0473 family)
MADRVESMADIVVSVGNENDITVERLSMTKDIDIEQVYGSNALFPDGYGINQVSYQGTIELNGNKLEFDDTLFDSNGVPQEFNIVLTHFDGTETSFSECLVTSEGYESSSGEITTTTYEVVAHGKSHEGQADGGSSN